MDDMARKPGAEIENDSPLGPVVDEPESAKSLPDPASDEDEDHSDSLVEEVANLLDDGVTYAQAEIAFQKTRAKLASRAGAYAAGYVAVALILLHISVLALAVGLVMALAPLVTIWGAVAIVVGALLLLTLWLGLLARSKVQMLSELFSSRDKE